jgi:hypothetical protein
MGLIELHGELHDGVHNVALVVLQGTDGLSAGNGGLAHDDLDLLVWDATSILVVVSVVLSSGCGRGALGLGDGAGSSLGGISWSILHLSLTEDDEGVGAGEAVDLGLGDAEGHGVGLLDLDAEDSGLRLQTHLLHGLSIALGLLSTEHALSHLHGGLDVGLVSILESGDVLLLGGGVGGRSLGILRHVGGKGTT